MSIRSLIEINHDFGDRLGDEFLVWLGYYLKSGSTEDADWLRTYGVTVLGLRHHSGQWFIDGTPDGFPVQHVERSKPPGPKVLTDADVGFPECP